MDALSNLIDLFLEAVFMIVRWAPLWLPLLLLSLLVLLMWRAVSAMPRTRAVEVKADSRSRVRWDDVAGLDDARAELAEVVEFLRAPERFEKLGARVPKGVLLYGPPGTGKTLLAKAVAGESGAAFFSQPASAFVEVFAGVGASRIRKLFATARKQAPAIIFIDEIDAVGVSRSGTSFNREQDQTLNQLLVEMDGFAAQSGVIVMASTNRLDTLDRALLRPGRFDRQVFVSAPDLEARRAILLVHARGKPLEEGVDLDAIARATSGLSGAHLESICNEAAIRAARAGRDSIIQRDFDEALERVVAGLRTARTISDKEKRIIAWHEAGHVLVGWLLRGPEAAHKVTIIPTGRALGFTMSLPTEERVLSTLEELQDQLAILLAGRAAEDLAFGRISNGASGDLAQVAELTRAMVFEWGMGRMANTRILTDPDGGLSEETRRLRDAEQAHLADAGYARAQGLLREHRTSLDRLANELLATETLTGSEVATLLEGLVRGETSAERVGQLTAVRLPDA